MMIDKPELIDEVRDLAEDLKAEWPMIRARIPAWHPRLDGEGDGDGDGEGDGGGDDGDGEGEGSGDTERPSGKKKDLDYYRQSARWHERQARAERKAREEAEKKVKEREQQEKTEHEKAIEAARAEERDAVRKEADSERRADRLESATIRLASKGFKVKDEEGKEQTLRFADPDDAHTYIERMLRRGDLDADDLFDDKGKIQSDALTEALQELLEAKPHLVANGGTGRTTKVSGSADGGKGSGGGKSKLELSTEEQFARMKQHK